MESAKASGLSSAIRHHNTAALYDWLMEGFSFQGISDRIASGYIDNHGNATWPTVESLLGETSCECPKLVDVGTYRRCGFRKAAATCANPNELPRCPVAGLPLRKGDLNQLAFSLYFFLRDHCRGDLVGWIDDQFARVDQLSPPDPVLFKTDLLLHRFSDVYGVSTKLNAMMLSSLLLCGGRERPEWVKVGRSMVVVDSLVHNFLHRTGILAAFDQKHRYGPACHRRSGCVGVIQMLAQRIDAREFNASFPRTFPRFVEYAIWAFCAENEADMCNGRRINDRYPCARSDCPVGELCSRIQLHDTTVVTES